MKRETRPRGMSISKGAMMGANGRTFRMGRAGTAAAVLAGILAATAAGAAVLPTGHMLAPRPAGPSSEDLPAATSSGPYRIPTAFAYGLMGRRLASANRPGIVRISAEAPKATSARRAPLREEAGIVHLNSVPAHSAASSKSGPGSTPAVLPVNQAFAAVCPVLLRDQRKAVVPNPRFTSVYEGQCYHLSSAAAKAKFDANPRRYAPAHGGQDVVLLARGTHEAAGSLKHAGFYHTRLYLFQSAETARIFHENPAKFVGE